MDEKYLTWVAELIIADVKKSNVLAWLRVLKSDPDRIHSLMKEDLVIKTAPGAATLGKAIFNNTERELLFVINLIKTNFATEWSQIESEA